MAGLRLDDIDWRAAELFVAGRGARQDRLPLAADVGEAIASYLRRAASDRREVFLRARRCSIRSRLTRSPRPCVGRPPASGAGRGEFAPAAPHRGLRDGPSGRAAGTDRADAAACCGATASRCAAMSVLNGHVEDYLRLRWALGSSSSGPGICSRSWSP